MYLLDTDHLVVMQRRALPLWESLQKRLTQHSAADFHLAIISFHEQVLGANKYITRAHARREIVRGYQMMENTLRDFSRFQVLAFDDAAAATFDDLRSQKVRVGTMDLRIAAIAISNNLTVLSRNLLDFRRVPGLACEDWTSES